MSSRSDQMPPSTTVLWIDDERFALTNYKNLLERNGFAVHCAYTFSEGRDLIDQCGAAADLVIIDIMMPIGDESAVSLRDLELAKGGYEAGAVLLLKARRDFPNLRVVAYSSCRDEDVLRWLETRRIRFIPKTTHFRTADDFVDMIRRAAAGETQSAKTLRTFIVHGHDATTKWELKNYLQNVLGLPEPLILHERLSGGRTIIEKFEEEASDRNLVFAILTPDDPTPLDGARARQNVIYELGYFMAKLGRRAGRIILLYKRGVEIPSDLAGVVYIDITNGIEAAGEAIRRELVQLLDLI